MPVNNCKAHVQYQRSYGCCGGGGGGGSRPPGAPVTKTWGMEGNNYEYTQLVSSYELYK